ncbi:MAG: hypothetical protein F4Y02_14700 [Chloroflexi bacterium]|nr:hypothetical protein [Chloroflexota bacterium]
MIERLVATLFPTSADDGIDWRADAIALWQLQRSEASSLKTRALLDLQIVGHAVHERARQRWSRMGGSPAILRQAFVGAGRFVESAAGLSGPVDDPREEALAVVALGHIGVPDRQARSDVRRYFRRVRAAVAPMRHVSVAGILAAAAFILGLAAALGAISVILAIVVGVGQIDRPYYLTDGRSVAEVRKAAQALDHDQSSPLATMVPVAAAVVTAFGLVAGRAERNHWRRSGAHRTYRDLTPDGAHRLEIALLTTMAIAVASLTALLAYGGDAFVLVFTVFVPGALLLIAAARTVFAPTFDWALRHVSRTDAAAYARPLIERDIALEVAAEGESYGRGSFSARRPARDAAASLWAATTLRSMGISPDTRLAALQRRIQRKTAEAANVGLTRYDLMRYAGGGFGFTFAIWLLVRCMAWRIYEIDFAPFRTAVGLDAITLASGALFAAALSWIHRRHLAVV